MNKEQKAYCGPTQTLELQLPIGAYADVRDNIVHIDLPSRLVSPDFGRELGQLIATEFSQASPGEREELLDRMFESMDDTLKFWALKEMLLPRR
jgi:hypothetical protein